MCMNAFQERKKKYLPKKLFSLEKGNIAYDCCFCLLTDKYHGVILLPEGLIESIPEVHALLQVTWHT